MPCQTWMGGKMRSKGANRRRIREGSDASDDDYKIEDREFGDSDEYCSSLAGEELADDLTEEEEEIKMRVTGRLKRRNDSHTQNRGRVGKSCKERRFLYREDSDGDNVDDEDVVDEERDSKRWATGFPKRKRNGFQKAVKKNKASYMDKTDDCEAEGIGDDKDYNDLWSGLPRRKRTGVQKAAKRKKAVYMEESDDDYKAEDDDYKAEDDECDGYDDYNENEDEKDMQKGCSSKKQIGVQKALKKKKASYTEESDNDYEAEDIECDDEDEVDDDEDFNPDEIESDENELVMKKPKQFKLTPSKGKRLSGRKMRTNSRSINKSKRKKPAKKRSAPRKLSTGRRKRGFGPKRRRLVVDSDSDFSDSEPLLLDQEYTISEEEREQVREASKFCGHLEVTLRKNSSKKRPREEESLHQEREHKARKGKDKVDDLNNEAAKRICGICFSEEGKRTIRGTLDCCSHYFCFNCIMEWSKVESRCPFCKQRFTTISKLTSPDIGLRPTVVPVPERDQVYQPSEEELMAYITPYEDVICIECHHGGDDANMLLCDLCDTPAHTYCVGLSEVPEGNWYCEGCKQICFSPLVSESPSFTHAGRINDDLSARSSPSEFVREAIDLNRVYEPETSLVDDTEITSSTRPVHGDLQAGSSIPGAGVQTVRERLRREQQIAQFAGRTGANDRIVEWGRTRRLRFPSAARPNTSSFHTTFSQGHLSVDFSSSVHSMHFMRPTPSQSTDRQVWGQNFTGLNGSGEGSDSLPTGLAGIRSGDAWSIHRHSSMQ